MILFYLSLFIISQTSNPLIIAKNLTSIFEYFQNEESISHEKIGLYSNLTIEDFESTLIFLKEKFPELQIEYMKLEKESKNRCITSANDLSIFIPADILETNSGISEYAFQSHIKNIYGTLKVEVKIENGNTFLKGEQLFITSIGN